MPRLVRYGIGYDTIDVPAASEHNILVVNIPDFCLPEVANHALALLLACAKKIVRLDRWVRAGQWGDRGGAFRPPFLSPMGQIHGQTVGLVGFGQIARQFARRLAALDARVVAFDPYVPPSRPPPSASNSSPSTRSCAAATTSRSTSPSPPRRAA